jgi:transketolase
MASPLPSPLDPAPSPELEQLGIDVIRGLAMDAPRAAKSGHPGTAMALAPLAHVLFTRLMRHNPADPDWPDRDRFVLSNGHASILLYSMLYLTGYGLTLDDLRRFRSFGSKTPGHPELHHTKGVEVTTGPLGQGFANGVGMGVAERWLRSHFSPAASKRASPTRRRRSPVTSSSAGWCTSTTTTTSPSTAPPS